MSDGLGGHGPRLLGHAQCLALLRAHRFGRMAVAVDEEPTIFPVNYRTDGDTIVIRTAAGYKLEEAPLRTVAFEIDDADPTPDRSWGWSVLVRGPCVDITTSLDTLSEHLRDLTVQPWVPGAREHWLSITIRHLSGRAFGPVPTG